MSFFYGMRQWNELQIFLSINAESLSMYLVPEDLQNDIHSQKFLNGRSNKNNEMRSLTNRKEELQLQ